MYGRVQVSFPALRKPIKTGGLSTAFIECKQKCKQTFESLLSMGKGKCAERNLGTFFV